MKKLVSSTRRLGPRRWSSGYVDVDERELTDMIQQANEPQVQLKMITDAYTEKVILYENEEVGVVGLTVGMSSTVVRMCRRRRTKTHKQESTDE
jgi:hypothetical protein